MSLRKNFKFQISDYFTNNSNDYAREKIGNNQIIASYEAMLEEINDILAKSNSPYCMINFEGDMLGYKAFENLIEIRRNKTTLTGEDLIEHQKKISQLEKELERLNEKIIEALIDASGTDFDLYQLSVLVFNLLQTIRNNLNLVSVQKLGINLSNCLNLSGEVLRNLYEEIQKRNREIGLYLNDSERMKR